MRTLFNIKIPTSTDKEIRKIKRKHEAPTLHGNKVWDSTLLMMDFLSRYNLSKHESALDIGCGWGVLMTYMQRQGMDVVGIEKDTNVQPFVEAVAKMNKQSLDVFYEDYLDIPNHGWKHPHLITGCDICYWEEHIDNLLNMVKHATGTILIADQGRDTFWKLCKKVNGNIHDMTIKTPKKVHGYVLEIMK